MITEGLIKRINELANKKKSQGLTLAEKAEQKKLYKIYLASIREQVTTQLDGSGITPKGNDHQDCDCQDACCKHQHGPDCNHGKH